MYHRRGCGRPIYNAPHGINKTPVCLMHSHDPDKDDGASQAEVERILPDAGKITADFREFVFPKSGASRRLQ